MRSALTPPGLTVPNKTVADLRPGETAVIAGFGNADLANKLMEMGFLPGNAIRFNYRAPFGDPVCISVSGYDVAIRIAEARTIFVLA